MKNKVEILDEDNHLLVAVKPAGVLSQGDATKDLDMLTILKSYLKEKYQKPGNVFLGLVHRLDRPTAGVMVFAKTSKASARLSEQIRLHQFEKKYYAIVSGILPEKKGVFEDYLLKLDSNTSIVTTKEKGKYACLSYEVLCEKNGFSLVDVTLKTGRHHQIRVSFAHRGYPLYGDLRYGGEGGMLGLFAYHLSFFHPITKEKCKYSIVPSGGIWDLFKESYYVGN